MRNTSKPRTAGWKALTAGLFGACVALSAVSVGAQAQDSPSVRDILNYKSYSPMFSSSGQPTREQLPLIKEAGYERVIYIAFSTVGPAIPEEDQLIKELGLDYLHIPVDFNNPTARDFNAFADAMQREPDMKTLLHCQVNARATAFSFLYRVIYEDVPVEEAKRDMNINYRFKWLDNSGMKVADDGVWNPKLIYAGQTFELTDIAPTPMATDFMIKIEGHNRTLHIETPHLESPVSTATQEDVLVVWVPLDGVDCQVVVLVGLLVLARVSL